MDFINTHSAANFINTCQLINDIEKTLLNHNKTELTEKGTAIFDAAFGADASSFRDFLIGTHRGNFVVFFVCLQTHIQSAILLALGE